MLTRMRLEKRQLKMLFAHVVCYTHLLALLTDNSGGGGGGGANDVDQNRNAPTLNYIV